MGKRADVLERFGMRLRALRKERGYTQEGFAAACGLDRTYVGGIERGERNVALRNLEAIAQTLGLTLAELLTGV
jgi:transcriptional regulator with XRE-family HTH domain